jgi:hypothetical protein
MALVGIGLAGWMVAAEIAAAQTLAPNRWAWGNSTRRSVTTTTRSVSGGNYAGAAAVGLGAANLAVGVIGAAAAAMPGENRTDVPSWPPPASCARRYVGSWMVNYAGQTYTATIRPDGTGTAHCPLCMPSQRWTCRGNEYFLLDPVIITMRMSPDGRSWTSANGSGRRISGGERQVASASATGASRPASASDASGASGGLGEMFAPGQSHFQRTPPGGRRDLVDRFAGGVNGSCSDITGTSGGGARLPCPARGRTAGRGGQSYAGATQRAERAFAIRDPARRNAELRRAQLAMVGAARDLERSGNSAAAQAAIRDAHQLGRAMEETSAEITLSNGRSYRVANAVPADPPFSPRPDRAARCEEIAARSGRQSPEARACLAELRTCRFGAGCNETTCGTHLHVLRGRVPRMSENWVISQMQRAGCARFYRPAA